MKTTLRALAAAALVLIIFTRCSQQSRETDAKRGSKEPEIVAVNVPADHHRVPAEPSVTLSGAQQTTDEKNSPGTTPQSLQSSAAVENAKDSTHLFIRTADIKCRVKNVAGATYDIEDITRKLGGYVSYTTLTSTVENKNTIPVSADSSLETTGYSVQNTMVIRVPNTNLDSALMAMTPLVDHLDFRTIKANDAALQVLANKLKQARLAQHEQRLKNAIDNHGIKLTETTNAEDALLEKQEQADNSKINNLAMNDQVKFSTINLALYQPVLTEKTMVFNEKSVQPYEASLLTQLIDALWFGWHLLAELLLMAVRLWPLFMVALIALAIYRRWRLKMA